MKIAKAAIIISVTLFVISLTQDGFYTGVIPGQSQGPGLVLLLLGWMGLFAGDVSWFANPALLLAYYFVRIKEYGPAATASLASVILAASFLTRKTIDLLDTTGTITHYGTGYWLWLASAVIMALSSFYLIYLSKRETSTEKDNSSEN